MSVKRDFVLRTVVPNLKDSVAYAAGQPGSITVKRGLCSVQDSTAVLKNYCNIRTRVAEKRCATPRKIMFPRYHRHRHTYSVLALAAPVALNLGSLAALSAVHRVSDGQNAFMSDSR